jgi:starch-binding outer membrane protein, SusD/RagB family
LFLRAFCYYYLVSNWGDVPLITTTDVTQTAMAPRAAKDEVYTQMLSDLRLSVQLLHSGGEKVRANKWAAAALLARVSLQAGNWEEALGNAAMVINSGDYPLSATDSVFFKNSRSAILQFWTKDGYTFAGQTFVPANTSSFSFYPLTNDLMNAFEEGDVRKNSWTNTFTYAGTVYSYPYKYKKRSATLGDSAEYVMVLRIEEQYLISAEAKCQLNNVAGGLDDLNVIRSRAGLPILSNLSKADCLRAIEKERRLELFTEWGDRWLSLQRSDHMDVVMAAVKAGWKSSSSLYPIPQQERNRDPNLTQNQDY